MKLENIIKALLVIIVGIGLANIIPYGCTQEDDTIRVLEQQGYKDIRITGYRPLMAGNGEYCSTGFEATAPNGGRVSGAVTGGWLKGLTVRFD